MALQKTPSTGLVELHRAAVIDSLVTVFTGVVALDRDPGLRSH
jgi:hypothetical protein